MVGWFHCNVRYQLIIFQCNGWCPCIYGPEYIHAIFLKARVNRQLQFGNIDSTWNEVVVRGHFLYPPTRNLHLVNNIIGEAKHVENN